MSEFENNVTEEVTGNVDVTTEETPEQVEQEMADEHSEEKIYTQKEFEERVQKAVEKRVSRREAKIHREYQKKYGELENVLKAGMQKEDVKEITGDFRRFYEGRGVKIPEISSYSDRDVEVLARAEADEIIKGGLDEVTEELDRLTELGVKNMSAREKKVYAELARHHKEETQRVELSKLGVGMDVYGSAEFKEFAKMFAPNTPITEIYQIYNKTKPKQEVKTPGSMTSKTTANETVKDFYTRDEALKFTKKDFDRNPALFKVVERSMTKW